MKPFNPQIGDTVICRNQRVTVCGLDLPGRYVRYLVEFADGVRIWRWLFQLFDLDEFDFEPDGTSEYMVENIYGVQPGEDWLRLNGSESTVMALIRIQVPMQVLHYDRVPAWARPYIATLKRRGLIRRTLSGWTFTTRSRSQWGL